MSQVTEQSVRFQTALASIKLIQASAVLDLTEDDFDFLTSNKVWIATDRSRARRCVEACVYGTLDFVGSPRFTAPVEVIAAVFFFQAEDGIRDYKVTGVQTCALPIFAMCARWEFTPRMNITLALRSGTPFLVSASFSVVSASSNFPRDCCTSASR